MLIRKSPSFIIALVLLTATVHGQEKVAQYSVGSYGSSAYEHFGFWTGDKKGTTIEYEYGENGKTVKLTYLGKAVLKNDSCFKVQFPNKYQLYIIPRGEQLMVTDSLGQYQKTFTWQYEGPVNGIGTFCSVCAEGPADAMLLIRRYYMR